MTLHYLITILLIIAIIICAVLIQRKKSTKVKNVFFNILVGLYIVAIFSSTFFIDKLTDLNKLDYAELGANATIWMFVLLFFYNALLLLYFAASTKVNSEPLKKVSVVVGTPVSIVMLIFLPSYFKASIGNGYDQNSFQVILKFFECALAVAIPVVLQLLYRPIKKGIKIKEAWQLLYVFPLGLSMLHFGVISAIFGYGEDNLKMFSVYQLLWILVTIGIGIILYMCLCKRSNTDKYNALLILSLSLLIQFFKIYTYRDIQLWNLPIHICNMGTILIFCSLFFRTRKLCLFTYYINVFGATIATATPLIDDGFWQFSTFNFMYEHSLLIVIPILMVFLGVIERPKRKEIPSIIPFFLGYYLFSCISGAILKVYDANVNYFYVIKDTIAQYIPFLKPLRDISFTIGRAEFYPVYWVVIFIGIIGITYLLDFLYNYLYVFEDKRIEIRYIIQQEKLIKETSDKNDEKLLDKPLFEVKNLLKTYKSTGKTIIKGLNLEIKEGEIVWVLGGNGAGKSTLIKSITGIISADNNSEIWVDGKLMQSNQRECKFLIGYMPDNHTQYENLTGREYIIYVASLYDLTLEDIASDIIAYATKFKLIEALDNPIKTYSHGMRQKVALIAAIIHKPKILILDEPMSGLDYNSMLDMKTMIVDYAKAGNCVLYSSHLYDIMDPICTQIVILRNGVIEEYVSADDKEELKKLQQKLLKVDVWGETR